MQLVRGLHNLRPRHRGCVATIGNFDGVHRGHQAILERLRERASELGLPSCVVIFEPQPREYFAPDQAPARLTRLREKLQLLSEQGVDLVLCLAFNRRLRELSAAEFVHATLVDGLGVDDWVHLQRPHPQADQAVDFYLPQAHNTSGLELIRVAMSDSEEELLESQTARMLR